MRFRKRIAALLCAALVLNTVAPVSAAGVSVEDDKNIQGTVQDINEIKEQIENQIRETDPNSATWEDLIEFISLADSTLSNNSYMLRSQCGSVSKNDYGYIVQNGKIKYTLTDLNGKKIKGMKKDDVWWRTYVYRPEKQELIKSPGSVTVKDGVIQCGDQYDCYNTVFVFARYKGNTMMTTLLITPPTKFFGRISGRRLVTKAEAMEKYHVGDLIDIENIQKLVGATSENAVQYFDDKKKVSGNGYEYSSWAIPETAAGYKSDNRPSDLISSIRKGSYVIKINKAKSIDAIHNEFGSVTAFRPKKKGIYKVTYIVPDGYNKKFTVKVRVTD